jgi:peptidoglycan/LPS O-acetylase OafA/YrhL
VLIYGHPPPNAAAAIVLINNFLIPAPIALLYCGLIREDTVLSRALSCGLARILGRSSYSFYLLHMLVIDYVSGPLEKALPGYRPGLVLATFAMTWALAIGLFLFYEEPMNLAIRRSTTLRVGIQARKPLRSS